ncbi:MAG: lytic transglycosylase domain-containing protein, partial [Proteobacteria bacterium]|nr:lytic transglycosylase domain-containing protein [Pseudomonadota bacterium]
MKALHAIRASGFPGLVASLVFSLLAACPVHADTGAQRDPALKALLEKVIGEADCFTDKYDAIVWYKAMEPRLQRFVPSHARRIEILDQVYCEARRDPVVHLPPDLVLALIEVESRFDPWAVSTAGAVGLMQVMPFWPRQLGV